MTHTQARDGGAEHGAPIVYLPWVKAPEPQPSHQPVPLTQPSSVDLPSVQPEQAEQPEQLELDESQRADAIALPKLARKGLSSGEVRALLLIEVSAKAVDEAVDRYQRYGYLDDDRLASTLVEQLQRRKGLGPAALRRELITRALPADVIERALLAASDETHTIHAVASARLRSLNGLEPEVARRRLGSYLQRRGFSSSAISQALRELL